MFLKFESTRGTWVYHLLWERRRKQALSILRRGYGGNYKVREEKFLSQMGREVLIKPWFKPSPLIPWIALNFLWVCVMKLRV